MFSDWKYINNNNHARILYTIGVHMYGLFLKLKFSLPKFDYFRTFLKNNFTFYLIHNSDYNDYDKHDNL